MIALALLVPVGLMLRGPGILKGNQPVPLVARGVLAFLAFTSYYIALMKIPLADAAAVYMTAPLFVTLLSVPLLGEKVGIHRWTAVIAGFSAVVVILNPGSSIFQPEAAIPLFSALCYSLIPIINRRIGMGEHALTMAIYTTATYLFLILATSAVIHLLNPGGTAAQIDTQAYGETLSRLLQDWYWFSTADLLLVILGACIFSVALLCITQAYRIAIVSTVAPFEYSYLLWAALISLLFFGNALQPRTIVGGIAVVACGCYIVYRENRPATFP